MCGAPDPTAGASANDQTNWYLDEKTLHDNIKKILIKFCLPAPMVFSDVNYLTNSAPPAAAEWSSLLRPLRGREPEGMWNLLSIVREMYRRCDRNAIRLLEIITEECMACDQILIWWFNTKLSLLFGTAGHSGGKHSNTHSNANASQHACSSLCDEIVILWRLAALNPGLAPDERDMLHAQFTEWHLKMLNRIAKCRVQNVAYSNKHPNNLRTDAELFIGFKPAIEACYLDWEDYPIAGITHTQNTNPMYHCPFTCFKHTDSKCDVNSHVNSSHVILSNHKRYNYIISDHHNQLKRVYRPYGSSSNNSSNSSSDSVNVRLNSIPIGAVGAVGGIGLVGSSFGGGGVVADDCNRSSASSEGFCENDDDGVDSSGCGGSGETTSGGNDLVMPQHAAITVASNKIVALKAAAKSTLITVKLNENDSQRESSNSSSSSSNGKDENVRRSTVASTTCNNATNKTKILNKMTASSSSSSITSSDAMPPPNDSVVINSIHNINSNEYSFSKSKINEYVEQFSSSGASVSGISTAYAGLPMTSVPPSSQTPSIIHHSPLLTASSAEVEISSDNCTTITPQKNANNEIDRQNYMSGLNMSANKMDTFASILSQHPQEGSLSTSTLVPQPSTSKDVTVTTGANQTNNKKIIANSVDPAASSIANASPNVAIVAAANLETDQRRPSKDESLSSSGGSNQTSDEFNLYYFDTTKKNQKQIDFQARIERRKNEIFSNIKPTEDAWDILFARAEGLHAHGHGREACILAVRLAEELLANPPNLMIELPPPLKRKGKKVNINPISHQLSVLASATLAKCAFLCIVLAENSEHYHLGFRICLFGLEMPRPPASTKPLEVKLANQENDLLALLKRIPLGQQELQVSVTSYFWLPYSNDMGTKCWRLMGEQQGDAVSVNAAPSFYLLPHSY